MSTITEDTFVSTSVSAAPRHRILRRTGAVFAGLLATVVVTTITDFALHAAGIFPPFPQRMVDSLFLLATAYRIVYGVAGGYIAALLAPDRPTRHAVALGVVGVALSTVGAVVAAAHVPSLGPSWYPLTLIAIAIPTAWAGGRLRAAQLRARAKR